MSFVEMLLIAVGLAMDAFAVSVCKGLSVKQLELKHSTLAGVYFGGFQFLMPLIGYLLGSRFEMAIKSVDHWIAFVLLGLIGSNMIKEAIGNKGCECCEEEEVNDSIAFKEMVVLAIATSIDALAVGITFAFLQVDIVPAVSFIGICTFTLSLLGVKIGNVFGVKYKSKAEFAGGLILILLGCKILLEHLGILVL